ncbi:MAG TPA: cyclodeaminase/cyclohydrolase family protein [Candidatus Dormibacteraeota bacterium]|nr:cyclodeaminase/cyclohydrolase family protein [Candidatus Dormibacteraeota bacterium]
MSYLLEKIASKEPAPASGSACGAVVAAAAALVEKSARLSTKQWEGAPAALERATALRMETFELIEEDAQAYLAFVDAVRSRTEVETAHARTVDVPLRMTRAAAEVVDLAVQLANRGNPNLRADAVVAATLAAAAAESGFTLIAVNVGDGVDDPRLAEAGQLARKASGLALSVRPQDS